MNGRGEAYRTVYGPKWKAGNSPETTKLGEVELPVGISIEEMKALIRLQYPMANEARCFDEQGEYLFWTNAL